MTARTPCLALLAAAALATGCGSSSSGATGTGSSGGASGPASSSPSTTGGSTSGTSTTQSSGTGPSGSSGIPVKTTQKPAPTSMGTTIVITPTGFSPQTLLAPMGYAITWKNESGKVQSVHLDNFGSRVDSGPIQPGTAWKFNPHAALSIIYHSTYTPSFKAQLQVQAVGNS